eukprot:83050-Pleurochrysis_carterae.AAC.1
MALLMHWAVTVGDYNADRMVAIATTLQEEKPRERGMSSAPTATPAAILPDSVALSTAVQSPALFWRAHANVRIMRH